MPFYNFRSLRVPILTLDSVISEGFYFKRIRAEAARTFLNERETMSINIIKIIIKKKTQHSCC